MALENMKKNMEAYIFYLALYLKFTAFVGDKNPQPAAYTHTEIVK